MRAPPRGERPRLADALAARLEGFRRRSGLQVSLGEVRRVPAPPALLEERAEQGGHDHGGQQVYVQRLKAAKDFKCLAHHYYSEREDGSLIRRCLRACEASWLTLSDIWPTKNPGSREPGFSVS